LARFRRTTGFSQRRSLCPFGACLSAPISISSSGRPKSCCAPCARDREDGDGFGGHTALFGSVVSMAYLCGRQRDGAFARLLLDRGADPNARASLRKRLPYSSEDTLHEYRDVTPLGWGERFHDQAFVNRRAMEAIAAREGKN
jgi:hypothetical protein